MKARTATVKYRRLTLGGRGGRQIGEHTHIVEKALGHQLPSGAEVHHIDGNGLNNAPSNLVVCPSRAYHKLLHVRQAAMDATGDANQRKCVLCGRYDKTGHMAVQVRHDGRQNSFFHAACAATRGRLKRAAKKAVAVAALSVVAACGGGGSGGTSMPPSFGQQQPSVSQPKQTTEQPLGKVTGCSVIFYGDSITALTAPRMGKGLQVTVKAQVGGTAQSNLATFLQDPLDARFVAINFGMNDSNGAGAMTFDSTVRSMLDRAKALGRTPVLTGISKATAGDVGIRSNLNLLLSQLAKDYGALWADWPATNGALMADGIHPADEMQQALADRLTQAITAVAPECAAP